MIFDNIVKGYWHFFMNEDYESVSLQYSNNKLQGMLVEEFVNHSPAARGLQILPRVLPTPHVVYQIINHRNLWSIA